MNPVEGLHPEIATLVTDALRPGGETIDPARLVEAIASDAFLLMRAAERRLSLGAMPTSPALGALHVSALVDRARASGSRTDWWRAGDELLDELARVGGAEILFDMTAVDAWTTRTDGLGEARGERPTQLDAARALLALVDPERPLHDPEPETETWVKREALALDAVAFANLARAPTITLDAHLSRLLHDMSWRRELLRLGYPLPRPTAATQPCPIASARAFLVIHDDAETHFGTVIGALREVLSLSLAEAFTAAQRAHDDGAHRLGPFPTAEAHGHLCALDALATHTRSRLRATQEPV